MAIEVSGTVTNRAARWSPGPICPSPAPRRFGGRHRQPGGSLETVNGNMTLIADQVSNQATVQSVSETVYQNSGDQSVPRGPCTYDSTACKGEYWSSWVWIVNPTAATPGPGMAAAAGSRVRSWIVKTARHDRYGGQHFVGGSLQIAAGGISNLYGTISSAGNMDLSGGSLTNIGGQLTESCTSAVRPAP